MQGRAVRDVTVIHLLAVAGLLALMTVWTVCEPQED